jgi:hypothetical protein
MTFVRVMKAGLHSRYGIKRLYYMITAGFSLLKDT